MNRTEILLLIEKNHITFLQYLNSIPEEKFAIAFAEKWSPRQNAVHIYRAIEPLVLAYKLPKFLLRILFGKSNRPSKTYDELKQKYQAKLIAGGRASGRFIPPKDSAKTKQVHIQKIENVVLRLDSILQKNWSEKDLDTYIFPHPLLGKITAREMLYFTAFHVQHHEETMLKIYKN